MAGKAAAEDEGPKMNRPTDSLVVPEPVALPDAVTPKLSIDDDILAPPPLEEAGGEELPTVVSDSAKYFEQIYEEFIAMKQRCGESTDNLTFERFSKKLQKNKDALIEKRSCSSVKFQVYEKDGKAALKASPVK